MSKYERAKEWGVRHAFAISPDLAEFLSDEIRTEMEKTEVKIEHAIYETAVFVSPGSMSKIRERILELIATEFKHTRRIANELGISRQETHDCLRRMFDTGLVEKRRDGQAAYWRKRNEGSDTGETKTEA